MNSGFRIRPSLCTLLALASVLAPGVEGSDSALPSIDLVTNNGFCANGVWGSTRWPGDTRPGGLKTWGSFCGKGNDNVGRAETRDFLAPSAINLYLAGYPGSPGCRLILKNVESGEERELTLSSAPREEWHFSTLPVPPEWIGKRVQFIAEDHATGPDGWLGFSLPILPASSLALPVIDTSTLPGGYCPDGVYGTTKWPAGGRPKGVSTWGSYCKAGDKDTGWAASLPVNADSYISIYIAGYPDTPGLPLGVENLQTGQQLLLHVSTSPGELWELRQFRLPVEWKGQLVRVISRDQVTGARGWTAFSEPLPITLADKALGAATMFGLMVLLTAGFLAPSIAACVLAARTSASFRGVENLPYLTATALLILGFTFWICFSSRFWTPDTSLVIGFAGLLAAGAILVYFPIAKRRGLGLPRVSRVALTAEAARREKVLSLSPKRRWQVLILTWGLAAIALLPAIFQWAAPPPYAGSDRYLPIGFGYFVAAAICYGIYRAESRRLTRPQAVVLVLLVILFTGLTNNLHSFNVDQATNYFPDPNRVWQNNVHNLVMRFSLEVLPHSYRFLPNSIVRWMQLARIDFDSARDLYRLIVGLLLFYSIYKYARLYCNYTGALISMLFIAAVCPVTFEHYGGQLTDPLSHLSFVLAFIFLETEEFALLLSTLLIGSLAKETVLAMAGYYVLFHRKERNYLLKAAVLCVAGVAVYFGVRVFVLHGMMHYNQASGMMPDHVWENWQNGEWQEPFLLTVGALLPFLALGWKQTALALKRQALFLLPVLFISGLLFSWLRESRNFMPLVFVLAVIAGGYLSRQLTDTLKLEAVRESDTQPKAEAPLGV